MPDHAVRTSRYGGEILDTLLEGCTILDFNLRYIYVNDAAVRHMRGEREALIGNKVTDLYPDLEGTALITAWHTCLTDRVSSKIEFRYVFADGDIAWYEFSIQPIDEGIFMLSLDVTGRKHVEDLLRERTTELERMVAELNTTEAALKHSEAQFRSVVEDQTELICRYDADFCLTFVNRAYADAQEKSPEELIGAFILSRIPENEVEKVIAHVRSLTPDNPVATSEHHSRMPDGSLRWFQWTDRVLLDDNGNIIEYQGVGRDITARKEAEAVQQRHQRVGEALRDGLAALTSSLDVETVMYQILEHAANVVACDAATITEFSVDGPRVSYSRGYSSMERDALTDFLRTLENNWALERVKAGQAFLISDTHETPDWVAMPGLKGIRAGIGVPIEMRGHVIGMLSLDSAEVDRYSLSDVEYLGTFARYAALALENAYHAENLERKVDQRTRELTSAKEHVETLLETSRARERELRFHASLQQAVTDAVIANDLDFRIQSWNRAAELMFGWRAEEVIGRRIDEILPLSADTLTGLRAEFHENGFWSGKVEQRRKDGATIFVHFSLVRFTDENGQPLGAVSVNRDVTERVATENALQEKSRQEYELQTYLRDLHLISVELTQIDDLSTFYRRAVELALERFGFDRFALMLADDQRRIAQATFGTDRHGQVIDERSLQFDPRDFTGILWRARQQSERFCYDQDVTLYANGAEIGRGWNAAAVLWNGKEGLGWVTADNAVTGRAATSAQLEILGLYSSTLGAILAQKQAESALRESEEKFRMLLEAAPVATVITDRNGCITLVNEQTEKLFGCQRADVIGKPIEIFVPDSNRDEHQKNRQTFVHTPHRKTMALDGAVHARRIDGTLFPAEVDLSYVRMRDEIQVMSFVTDITERLRAAAALEQQREFLRRVIDVSPSLIFVKDFDGRFIFANALVSTLYGTTHESLIGKTDADFNASSTEVSSFLEADRRVIASDEPLYIEEAVTGSTGETHWFQTTKVPIVGADGHSRYVLGVSTDITQRKQAEEALRQGLAKEKELGELKSRFVSIASHEFRTPLATILASAETLSAYRGNMRDDQIEDRLQKIREQVDHLTDIMDDVLHLARLQARRVEFNPVRLDIDALCRDIVEEFSMRSDVNHPLVYACEPGFPLPLLDKKLMRQVINNLISNAVKYSADSNPVYINLEHNAGWLYLRVRDKGIGIPDDDLRHLFEPFHRAQNVGAISGTGLGLTITLESVKLHGGTVDIESQVGAGTTVTVAIPSQVR